MNLIRQATVSMRVQPVQKQATRTGKEKNKRTKEQKNKKTRKQKTKRVRGGGGGGFGLGANRLNHALLSGAASRSKALIL